MRVEKLFERNSKDCKKYKKPHILKICIETESLNYLSVYENSFIENKMTNPHTLTSSISSSILYS